MHEIKFSVNESLNVNFRLLHSILKNRPFHKLRHKYREPRFRIISMTIDSQQSDLKVFPIDKSVTSILIGFNYLNNYLENEAIGTCDDTQRKVHKIGVIIR